ncbi:hypothetical protein [Blastococcus sp. TBT05-19]|uniref:hypothetical protein n=1 Tax=Blastococcus sp. TBT05-19 TaxID=2250581 RepID=UPI0013144B5D|nr:hypothetical protein [Blastococcus sp. TBT05-19]
MTRLHSRTRRACAAAAIALTTGLGVAACGAEEADRGTTLEDINEEGAEDLGDVETLEDDVSEQDIAQAPNRDDSAAFFDDPDSFTDEPVTVRGRIVEVLSPYTFVIGEGDMATLVTRANPDGVTLLPGYTAQVTGDVGTFLLPEVEEDLDVDLVDETVEVFQDGPFIAAVDVNLLDED